MLLLAATVDRFEVLKGLGVEARIKKLDGAIDQATATLDQLRDLSEITGESLVLLNAKGGAGIVRLLLKLPMKWYSGSRKTLKASAQRIWQSVPRAFPAERFAIPCY
jgi:hypothetical protein